MFKLINWSYYHQKTVPQLFMHFHYFFMSKTAFNMIVYDSNALHMGITCGGSDELESEIFQLF